MLDYRDRVARAAFSNYYALLRRWLEFGDGYEMDGQWFPSTGIDLARCIERVRDLTPAQIHDLCVRGMISPEAENDPRYRLAFPLTIVREVGESAIIAKDADGRVMYDFEDDIMLHDGELELLEAAG